MRALHLIAYVLLSFSIYVETKTLMDLVYVDHIECNFNKSVCAPTTCFSKFYNRTLKLATVSCGAIAPIESIQIRSSLYYHFTGGYRQLAIDLKNDWCKFVDGSEKSILLDVFLKYIKGYSNLHQRCPYTDRVFVSGLPMTAGLFGGQLLPAGKYYYQMIAHLNGAFGLSYKVYFYVPTGTIFDDAMGK